MMAGERVQYAGEPALAIHGRGRTDDGAAEAAGPLVSGLRERGLRIPESEADRGDRRAASDAGDKVPMQGLREGMEREGPRNAEEGATTRVGIGCSATLETTSEWGQYGERGYWSWCDTRGAVAASRRPDGHQRPDKAGAGAAYLEVWRDRVSLRR